MFQVNVERDNVEQVDLFDGVATVTRGDTLLTLWEKPATVPRIRHVNEIVAALLARSSGTVAACQFLLSSASPPGPRQLGEIRAGLRLVLPRARRLIVVPLGNAAWHSIVRGILRAGLFVLGRSKIIKVAPTPGRAFVLLRELESAAAPELTALESAYEGLFAALGVPAPT